MTAKRFKHSEIIQDDGQTICYGIEDTQTRHIFNVPFVDDGLYEVSEKELIKLLNELHEENEQLKSFVEYEKRQHKHWKRECLENIKEIAQLKREIVQLKGE